MQELRQAAFDAGARYVYIQMLYARGNFPRGVAAGGGVGAGFGDGEPVFAVGAVVATDEFGVRGGVSGDGDEGLAGQLDIKSQWRRWASR